VAQRDTAIGCDVETIESRSHSFIADYFTPGELSEVDRMDPAGRPLISTLIWSAKESTLKALKKGLSRDTRSVVIRPGQPETDSGWNRLEAECVESGRKMPGWWKTADGMVFTIVADGVPEGAIPVELV
jgi:4'-phosphopantetheinyl transferase